MDGLVGYGRGIEPSTVPVRSEPLTTAPQAPMSPEPKPTTIKYVLNEKAAEPYWKTYSLPKPAQTTAMPPIKAPAQEANAAVDPYDGRTDRTTHGAVNRASDAWTRGSMRGVS
ncbi:hypothetical protein Y032_0048g1562 [Ancylostoma ceylanicum]|uniref:Uncharacterized protein n=1 Tax=Ancylostoma ceylanicum TaxID=53326 RepID=A0A016U9M8_9BILA|nr:hypothetical protein Y032_0048g1562 [Ancylostoma ceylanicum]